MWERNQIIKECAVEKLLHLVYRKHRAKGKWKPPMIFQVICPVTHSLQLDSMSPKFQPDLKMAPVAGDQIFYT